MALVATPHPFTGIFLHGRPKIALLKCLEREGDPSIAVPADAFVYFAEDLGRLDAIEASEQWR